MIKRLGSDYDSPKHISYKITDLLYSPRGFWVAFCTYLEKKTVAIVFFSFFLLFGKPICMSRAYVYLKSLYCILSYSISHVHFCVLTI